MNRKHVEQGLGLDHLCMCLPASIIVDELKSILAASIWDVASKITAQKVLKQVKKWPSEKQTSVASTVHNSLFWSLHSEEKEACLFSPWQWQLPHSNSILLMWLPVSDLSDVSLIWRRSFWKLITDDSSAVNVSSYRCGVCHPVELQMTVPSRWTPSQKRIHFVPVTPVGLKHSPHFLQYLFR